MLSRSPRAALTALAATLVAVALAAPAAAFNPDNLVTVGSPLTPFSHNKQNEPVVAIDANHSNVLVAGSAVFRGGKAETYRANIAAIRNAGALARGEAA